MEKLNITKSELEKLYNKKYMESPFYCPFCREQKKVYHWDKMADNHICCSCGMCFSIIENAKLTEKLKKDNKNEKEFQSLQNKENKENKEKREDYVKKVVSENKLFIRDFKKLESLQSNL